MTLSNAPRGLFMSTAPILAGCGAFHRRTNICPNATPERRTGLGFDASVENTDCSSTFRQLQAVCIDRSQNAGWPTCIGGSTEHTEANFDFDYESPKNPPTCVNLIHPRFDHRAQEGVSCARTRFPDADKSRTLQYFESPRCLNLLLRTEAG